VLKKSLKSSYGSSGVAIALSLFLVGNFSLPTGAQTEPEPTILTPSDSPVIPLDKPPVNGETSTPPPFIPIEQAPGAPQEAEKPAEPQILVGEVRLVGVDTELENLVYNTIRTQPGRSTTRSQLQADIDAIYATGYFANVSVTPEDTPLGVRITFVLQPNPVLTQVVIQSLPQREQANVLPESTIQEIFAPQYGRILNLRDLQTGIRRLNEWYSQNGYDLAQVIGAPKIGSDGVVRLEVAEGLIEKIQVRFFDAEDEPKKGKTRDFIITREMRLKPGNIFNRNTAQQDLQRVFGLGLFEDVRLSFEPGSDPREVVVNVDVVEGRSGSLAAGAGISSSSGLFGTVSYQQQNLGGNNQTLGAEIQIGERELLFDVSFSDPWIATDPFRTSYTVNGFRRRSISLVYDGDDTSIRTANGNNSPRIVRTGGGVSFSRPLAKDVFSRPDWVLTTGLVYQNVRVENANGDLAPRSRQSDGFQKLAFNGSGVDDILTANFSAVRDFRDSPVKPTKGSLLRVGTEQTVPLSTNGIVYNRVRASYSYYIPSKFISPVELFDLKFLDGIQVVAFNLQGGTIVGDFPPYDAFVIGGSNSVRGWAEGELGSGRSYLQFSAEYRFPIYSLLSGAVFFDAGTTLGSQNAVPGQPGNVRGLPGDGLGYGLGVRIQSPVGPIRVDFGFNNNRDSRLHFGIGEKF
jgi:outer membrane protein insertion porin family